MTTTTPRATARAHEHPRCRRRLTPKATPAAAAAARGRRRRRRRSHDGQPAAQPAAGPRPGAGHPAQHEGPAGPIRSEPSAQEVTTLGTRIARPTRIRLDVKRRQPAPLHRFPASTGQRAPSTMGARRGRAVAARGTMTESTFAIEALRRCALFAKVDDETLAAVRVVAAHPTLPQERDDLPPGRPRRLALHHRVRLGEDRPALARRRGGRDHRHPRRGPTSSASSPCSTARRTRRPRSPSSRPRRSSFAATGSRSSSRPSRSSARRSSRPW